jgi:N-acylneuraminate cytidylyltransferase
MATGEEKSYWRQELPDNTYHRDGSIYITKTEVLLRQHSCMGKEFPSLSPEFYVNIDT